jgi:UDP:flavonoid glycosyltransferase YjiC (YdhE family)
MRTLLCSLDKPGFLFPAIGLAKALRSRGHEVAFVADRGAGAMLARSGFERLPRGDRDGRSFETAHWFRPLEVALQLQHVEHALARFAPDLLVGQALALGPLIARERSGLPVAIVGHATYGWPCGPAVPATERRRVRRQRSMLRLFAEARQLARLPALAPAADENSLLGDAFLLRSVAELQGAAWLPAGVHLVGACLWEPEAPDDELAAWVAAARRAGAPIACVHHGRSFGGRAFWRSLVEGLGTSGLRIAAATGRMEAGLEERMPAGAFYLRRELQASRVLRGAELMIGSASSSAVLAALSHGVPCLLVPGGEEQRDLAEQVERSGAGRILPQRGVTPAGLRRAVAETLADGSLRRRARVLQQAFARAPGFTRGVELLESLVGAGGGGPAASMALAVAETGHLAGVREA